MNAFQAVPNSDSSAAIPNKILPLSCTPKKREEQLSEESRPWPVELIFWKWKAYGWVNNLTVRSRGLARSAACGGQAVCVSCWMLSGSWVATFLGHPLLLASSKSSSLLSAGLQNGSPHPK